MVTLEELRKLTVSELVTLIEEVTGERVPMEVQLRLRKLYMEGRLSDEYLESIVRKSR